MIAQIVAVLLFVPPCSNASLPINLLFLTRHSATARCGADQRDKPRTAPSGCSRPARSAGRSRSPPSGAPCDAHGLPARSARDCNRSRTARRPPSVCSPGSASTPGKYRTAQRSRQNARWTHLAMSYVRPAAGKEKTGAPANDKNRMKKGSAMSERFPCV